MPTICLIALLALTPLASRAEDGGQASSAASVGPTLSAGADLALHALSFLGVPYKFGGQDPARGFDCSGLVRHVTQAVLGFDLPRSAEAMARVGQSVAREALQVGDLVFFNTRGRRFSHVGIYIGEGQFVHAPARRGQVRVEPVDGPYWQKRFNGARRLPPLLTTDSALTASSTADAEAATVSPPPVPPVPRPPRPDDEPPPGA